MRLIYGDSLEVLPTLESASFDVVLTDPPYPEILRPYGRMSEAEWHAMMRRLVPEVRRLLKPQGSAVFILQPNSRKVGSMRGWLWEFMAWVCREWNMVQDAWWWNHTALVTEGAGTKGTLRSSLKACVWCGPPDCYRGQDAVLWEESDRNKAERLAGRCKKQARPSGWRGDGKASTYKNDATFYGAAGRRGGVTPFNVIVTGGCNRWDDGGGAHGHGASTPKFLCDWWLRYLCPPGGRVLDPFSGSGTVALAALRQGKDAVGVEKMPEYHAIAERRLREAQPLFAGAP